MSGGVWPEGTHESRTCTVHPFGYHRERRVNDAPSRTVFRDARSGGLPRRCEWLEYELDVSGREPDFIDELWVRERAASGGAAAALGLLIGVLLGGLLTYAFVSAGEVDAALVGLAVLVLAVGVGVAAGQRALQRERLRRIRDWHRRVGSPR